MPLVSAVPTTMSCSFWVVKIALYVVSNIALQGSGNLSAHNFTTHVRSEHFLICASHEFYPIKSERIVKKLNESIEALLREAPSEARRGALIFLHTLDANGWLSVSLCVVTLWRTPIKWGPFIADAKAISILKRSANCWTAKHLKHHIWSLLKSDTEGISSQNVSRTGLKHFEALVAAGAV